MDKPKPIATAPRDGSVILSDCGLVRLLDQARWGSPVPHGEWALCDSSGQVYSDSEDGILIENPKLWVPKPEWIQ